MWMPPSEQELLPLPEQQQLPEGVSPLGVVRLGAQWRWMMGNKTLGTTPMAPRVLLKENEAFTRFLLCHGYGQRK